MRQAKESKACDIFPQNNISPKNVLDDIIIKFPQNNISPKNVLDDIVIKYHFEGKYNSSLVK